MFTSCKYKASLPGPGTFLKMSSRQVTVVHYMYVHCFITGAKGRPICPRVNVTSSPKTSVQNFVIRLSHKHKCIRELFNLGQDQQIWGFGVTLLSANEAH